MIDILLTATSYFSPPLHYVWILTSRIFLKKRKLNGLLSLSLPEFEQGLDISRDMLITFCFTHVSCDIQIHQLINGIKYASALADCVPLSHSATVINIRILLKATSYFSPPLHYVWIFTSRIFLNKKNWVDCWVYHCLNLKLWLQQYPLTLLSLSYHNFIKELGKKMLEMILRFYTYVIPSFKIDIIVIFAISKPIMYIPVLVTNIPSWFSMWRTRWPPKSSESICQCCG